MTVDGDWAWGLQRYLEFGGRGIRNEFEGGLGASFKASIQVALMDRLLHASLQHFNSNL